MSVFDRFRRKDPSDIGYTITNVDQNRDFTYMNDSQNYLDQYEGWTYKAIKTKADAVINHEIKLYKNGEDKIEVERDREDLLKDLYAFNPYQTYRQARHLSYIHLGLTGTAFWLMTASDQPKHKVEFYVLDPTRIQLKTNQFGLPSHYVFSTIDGNEEDIAVENLIVFNESHPKDWMKGYGALQASRYAHNTHELAMKYNMNAFGNDGRPEGLLFLDGISAEEAKKIEKKMQSKYAGAKNAKKFGVTNKEPKFVELTKSPKDMDYEKSVREMRDQILSIHGVPKALVGLDDSTFSNAWEAQRVFQMVTLTAMLNLEEDVYNEQLIPKYYDTDKSDIIFIADDPVDIDMDSKAVQSSLLYEKRVIKLNEAREMVGLQEVDDGDQYFTPPSPFNLQPTDVKEAMEPVIKKIEKQNAKINELSRDKVVENQKREELREFFYQKNISSEKTFKQTLKEYFEGQEKRVQEQLKTKKSINLKFNIDWLKELKIAIEVFTPVFINESIKYNDLANDLTGGSVELEEETIKKIEKDLETFAEEINKTTKEDLTKLLVKAVEEDLTLSQTRSSIKELFTLYSDKGADQSRSDLIARTEINNIKNKVSRDNYAQNDYVKRIEWLAAKDSFVRGSKPGDQFDHVSADGQRVEIGRKFSVSGEPLAYPGDKSGSAGNVINCRCTTIPIILD